MKPTLIVDADDTLWENNIFYERCIAEFVELMAQQGFGREEAAATMDAVERERIPQVGYAPEEFARSMAIAYRRLCERHARPADEAVAEAALHIGRKVIQYPIILLDGVEETLRRLKGSYCLILLTKGHPQAQEDKLARSGLMPYFDHIYIVREKNARVLRELIAGHGLRPEQTWMVGNSPRSDVNPALEAGIGAVYVPHPATWQFEIEEIAQPERVITLERFSDLPMRLAQSEG